MAVIRRSLPWVVQPPGFSEIDWQHPFANRLRFALNPATGLTNLAGGGYPVNLRSLAFGAGQSGVVSVSGEAEYSTTLGLTNGLTLFTIMRARAAGYQFSDGARIILSSRTAANKGWVWSRVAAAGGGAFGNVTGQGFTLNGVAGYSETNKAIDSERNVPVAVRYDRVEGKISWFADGVKSSPDTAAAKTGTDGAGLVYRQEGPFSSPGTSIYLDQLNNTLAFAGLLSDDEIADLSANPWQIYKGQRPSTIISLGSEATKTTVSAEVSGAWSVRNASASSASGAWSVRVLADASTAGAWSVRSLADASTAGAWSVRNLSPAAYLSGAWSIEAAGLASASLPGSWSVRAMAPASIQGAWSVRNAASSLLAGAWSSRNAASGALSGAWSVEAPGALTVGTSVAGAWSVAGFAESAMAGAWSVQGTATAYLTGSWRVRGEYAPEPESLYLSIANANTHLSKASGAQYLSIARI